MDYEIQRCSRTCAVTGRSLVDGEMIYSAVVRDGRDLKRLDYAADAWAGPPAEAISWWRSRVPSRDSRTQRATPSDLLLQLFDDLEQQPDQRAMRYVLTLLLLRRRIFRQEETAELSAKPASPSQPETIQVYCSRRDATYRVEVAVPDLAQIKALEQRWTELLGQSQPSPT